jgi:hypothetical protein
MPAFRIYTVGRDGHFKGAKDIECADDQEAINEAQQVLDGRDIEVWERGRFITRLAAKPSTKK